MPTAVLVRHCVVVPASRREIPPAVAAAVLVITLTAAVLFLPGPTGATAALAVSPSCSSYPTPGALAPPGAKVPAGLASEYSILRGPQRTADRLKDGEVASLGASGVIMSGTRFLGDAAFGGRIYLVPARHLLAFRLAPPRCLAPSQRSVERELLPLLRSEYREAALCIEVLYGATSTIGTQGCAPATGAPDALLSASGTPGFGLVPNGVSAVTVTYQTAPPRTVAVHRNSFTIVAPSPAQPPCGIQWLDPTGNVQKVVFGCSYLAAETRELYEYRSYVAGKLTALRSQIVTLSGAIGSRDLAKAQSAWLTAHLTWLDVGQDDGAYGCFGALGGEIDGLAAGHPRGTADPAFTGFHRIEFDLWSKHDLAVAAIDTTTLQKLLAQLTERPLSNYLPATANGVGNWLLRPHEALEDALRDSLTADDDYGSGTDLASLTADVAAVRELLSELQPTLDLVAPHLVSDARAQLQSLISAIDTTRVNGAWVSVQDVPVRQRQQVDADVGAALETLAPIPELLTSTGANSPTS